MKTDISALQNAFRGAMARVCSPVSVVTTVTGAHVHATTVSAFSSLSMTPPMVLVSLAIDSDLLNAIKDSGRFGVNVLAHDQSNQALRFATKGSAKSAEVQWRTEHGCARLPGAATWIACATNSIVSGGDHDILLGEVLEVEYTDREPLTYFARSFGTHLRHADAW